MRKRYQTDRARKRAWILILLLMMMTVFLVSCVAGGSTLWFKGLFGLDLHDYISEEASGNPGTDSVLARELTSILSLAVGEAPRLSPFQTTSQAVSLYRENILRNLLTENYARYTGDSVAISAVEKAYPHTVTPTLISAGELENTVFRYFGGTSMDHRSTGAFVYLSRAGYYSAPVCNFISRANVNVLSLEETANTYRLRFTLSNNGETSDPYLALFVKRDDGTCYWKALEC